MKTDWQTLFTVEKDKPYYGELQGFIESQRDKWEVYPPQEDVFNAFKLTPLADTKVVILGQDPYHGPGQAHGLSFSVPAGCKFPPSLRNMFKQLSQEIDDYQIPLSGDLTIWAKQGVLLLNTVLTVSQGQAHSHAGQGWETFTDRIIRHVSDSTAGCVFLLWGAHAIKKRVLISSDKHHILTAPHPSPLSAHRGFFGCNHFTQANNLLMSENKTPISW